MIGRKRASGRFVLLGLLTCAAGVGAPALAQEGPEPGEPAAGAQAAPAEAERPAPEPALTPEQEARLLDNAIAERLARLSIGLVRSIPEPTLDDFTMTALGLRLAQRYADDDLELLRLEAEAWTNAQDGDRLLEATRRIVRLDPTDTVAQLSVISQRVNRMQTIEQRFGALRRLAGAEELPRSVRSRLALDASMLARELGRDDDFVDLLTRAVQLDQTNKQAVVTASSYYLDRSDDPEGRVEMLSQVVLADPLDPQAHFRLARELLAHGAYDGASRFFTMGLQVQQFRGESPSENIATDELTIRWATRGGEKTLEELAETEAAIRYRIDRQREALEQAGEDPAQVQPYRPSPITARVRLLIASAVGRPEVAAETAETLKSATARMLQATAQNGGGGEAGASMRRNLAAEVVRLRAWAGVDLDATAADLEVLAQEGGGALTDRAAARYRGLIAAHRGQRDRAFELLTPLAEDDDALARLGLAIAEQAAGRSRAAAARYASVFRDRPGTLTGLWAHARLESILETEVSPPNDAAPLESIAASAPQMLERIVNEPRSFQDLRLSMASGLSEPLAPVRVEVTLRNVSTLPLSVGRSATINTRLLLAPRLSIDGRSARESLRPEVRVLSHRLRLAPNGAINRTLWLGVAELGQLLDATAPLAATLRFNAKQAFYADSQGQYVTGPYGLIAESNLASRRPDDARPSAEQIVESLRGSEGAALARALLRARWKMFETVGASSRAELARARGAIAQTLAERWPSLDQRERLFTLIAIPAAWNVEQAAPLDEAALDGLEGESLVVYLITRVDDPEHPLFERLDELDDEARELASIYRQRLRLTQAQIESELQK